MKRISFFAHATTPVARSPDQAALQRESARRLAALGGSDPDIQAIPRRRSQVA
jgi:hypothetical protein